MVSRCATETFFTSPELGLAQIRPARKDEKQPRYFPNSLRQRVEAPACGGVPSGLRRRELDTSFSEVEHLIMLLPFAR